MTDARTIAATPPTADRMHWNSILGKLDLAAILVATLGVCLGAGIVAVMAIFETAKLISASCADSNNYWPLAVFGSAAIWAIARGKWLCLF